MPKDLQLTFVQLEILLKSLFSTQKSSISKLIKDATEKICDGNVIKIENMHLLLALICTF